ncbi:hypothetical protein MTR_1g064720 [Medicago truncatula]|uniref:Uncharacterized protein n=1 Tax=Medicago truncatula TaxID=3880 RepID=A0A072VKV9_MEDTR|nr:hypothetical protein MTR_1g064720 [Medicago truncatula]
MRTDDALLKYQMHLMSEELHLRGKKETDGKNCGKWGFFMDYNGSMIDSNTEEIKGILQDSDVKTVCPLS